MENTTRWPKIKNRQKMDVLSLSLDKEDLRKFCDILQERANSAADIEVNLLLQNEKSDEQHAENKVTIRDSFELKITVTGIDGYDCWGSIKDVFDSTNFPEQVTSLYVDSESTLRYVHNYYPHNLFKVFLDFRKPKVFDFSLSPNTNTPNQSNIEVNGYDLTWVNGVFSEIKSFVEKRSSKTSTVHHHSIYDILLLALGFPFSFWVCSKVAPLIEASFGSNNLFVTSALYLYAFVATLFLFRVLFHYIRWVCPLVEYRSKNNNVSKHRAVLAILAMGVCKVIYEIVIEII